MNIYWTFDSQACQRVKDYVYDHQDPEHSIISCRIRNRHFSGYCSGGWERMNEYICDTYLSNHCLAKYHWTFEVWSFYVLQCVDTPQQLIQILTGTRDTLWSSLCLLTHGWISELGQDVETMTSMSQVCWNIDVIFACCGQCHNSTLTYALCYSLGLFQSTFHLYELSFSQYCASIF